MDGWEPTNVRCYSGYTYAQEPRSFTWLDEVRPVARIERAWQTPGGRRFLVCDEGDTRFLLEYRERADCWVARSLENENMGSAGQGPLDAEGLAFSLRSQYYQEDQ